MMLMTCSLLAHGVIVLIELPICSAASAQMRPATRRLHSVGNPPREGTDTAVVRPGVALALRGCL
jgi:hypothetical protein